MGKCSNYMLFVKANIRFRTLKKQVGVIWILMIKRAQKTLLK